MLLLMCSDPFETRRVDEDWAAERAVARAAGLEVALVHWESIVAGDGAEAVRRVGVRSTRERAIYRGWMLAPTQYRVLDEALRGIGIDLITTPERYAWAHTLPGWYASLEGMTPRSCSLAFAAGDSLTDALALARSLAASCPAGIVVKDYVKSRKHEWSEACFIPDVGAIERVTSTFVDRQGDIVGGLVFREFVRLRSLGPHPKSGMPMSLEVRVFAWKGEVLAMMPYWPEAGELADLPPKSRIAEVLARVGDSFVTIDLACAESGEWIVMEIGDGQVSGLPRATDAEALYSAMVAVARGS